MIKAKDKDLKDAIIKLKMIRQLNRTKPTPSYIGHEINRTEKTLIPYLPVKIMYTLSQR